MKCYTTALQAGCYRDRIPAVVGPDVHFKLRDIQPECRYEIETQYDPDRTRFFYNAYGEREWSRLEDQAYGRLQAIIHTDFIKRYVRPGDLVLDAGSGPGRFSIAMVRLGARVTLLDLSDEQLKLARENLEAEGLVHGAEGLVRGDITDLSMLQDGYFDRVVCFGGALSYVCEQRKNAAAELVRVVKPDGHLLVSVMSRFGAAANVVRRPELDILNDPDGRHLWSILDEGDRPGFPSSVPSIDHPPMHLYSADELRDLFGDCEVLELAGSNVTTFEGSLTLADVEADPKVWDTAVEIERRLNRAPGLVDSGTHIIMVARRPST